MSVELEAIDEIAAKAVSGSWTAMDLPESSAT